MWKNHDKDRNSLIFELASPIRVKPLSLSQITVNRGEGAGNQTSIFMWSCAIDMISAACFKISFSISKTACHNFSASLVIQFRVNNL
ncbi:hypothetical protein D3C81_1183840 [compost metagenome]